MPVAAGPATPHVAALVTVMAGGPAPAGAAGTWACEVMAGGSGPTGIDPSTVPVAWREPLAEAGVPLAPDGDPWDATVEGERALPAMDDAGRLCLPSLERFSLLTSLPAKPLRIWVQSRYGIRLQVGMGVRLWLWRNQFVVVNDADTHRGGFIHGPLHGMRTVLALDPGQAHVVRW